MQKYNIMSNTVQQLFPLSHYTDQKDQTSTQADSTISSQNLGFIIPIVDKLSQLPEIFIKQHTITASLSSNIFNADKMFKAAASVIRVLKAYNLASKISSFDKLSGEIGQLRRLLRIDRLFMLVRQLAGFLKKKQLDKTDKCIMIFKAMIFIEDLTDLFSLLVQLSVLKKDKLLPNLRRNVANLYFLECMGWLAFHLRQYFNSKTSQDKQKNKITVLRYILDGLVAHNDFACKLFTVSPKTASVLSISSAFLSLYLVWK